MRLHFPNVGPRRMVVSDQNEVTHVIPEIHKHCKVGGDAHELVHLRKKESDKWFQCLI